MLVALLAILNWAAPSIISVGSLAVQEAFLNSTLNAVGFDGLGLVFSPVWERKKGLLYKTESLLFGNIANANVTCDEKSVLYFQQRPHGRDKRHLE